MVEIEGCPAEPVGVETVKGGAHGCISVYQCFGGYNPGSSTHSSEVTSWAQSRFINTFARGGVVERVYVPKAYMCVEVDGVYL